MPVGTPPLREHRLGTVIALQILALETVPAIGQPLTGGTLILLPQPLRLMPIGTPHLLGGLLHLLHTLLLNFLHLGIADNFGRFLHQRGVLHELLEDTAETDWALFEVGGAGEAEGVAAFTQQHWVVVEGVVFAHTEGTRTNVVHCRNQTNIIGSVGI